MPYELFISYSRKDNIPQKPGDATGWVTALRDEILADHRRFSTEPLRIFFDTSEIEDMDDWRHRILTGLRESRILLVCLSPDYFKSPPCLWEWEEYLKRQVHALMGQESVAPVYFVEAPGSDEQINAAWAESVTRKAVAPADRLQWEERWKAWREATLGRPNSVDLKPWFPHGIEALCEAAVRDKLTALGTSLWKRIQRARRATGVPGNLRRLNPHFIGRHPELRQLHEKLALGAVGVVTAVHGLGGLGKTELATAYAYGWADSYPAGLWVLGAEGNKEILPLLGELCAELQIPPPASTPNEADGRRVLAELKRRAVEAAPRDPDKGAACLIILDNVSEAALLAEPQLTHLPREDWLRVVVTTREGPEKFPASRQKSLAFIAVDALTEDDASRLIQDHQLDMQWPAATAVADAAAAREIARELGGFTLAIESVAIYLGLHPDIRPADYLVRLRAEGLPSVDALPADADVAVQMQHREKQLRLVLDQTLARLAPFERTALDYAALLPPDSIPWLWLRAFVEKEHPDALAVRPGYPDSWPALRRRLEGLRLLQPGTHVDADGQPHIARFHRLIQQFMLHDCSTEEKTARQELLSNFVMQRVTQKRVFWTESWERRAISALADLWSGSQRSLDEFEPVRSVLLPSKNESQPPNVAKLRQFIARELLRQLGWSSKGKVKEEAERAVETFNKAIALHDRNQLEQAKKSFLQSVNLFREAGNDTATIIARIYSGVLLLELGEADERDDPLRTAEKFPEYLDVNCLLSRMIDRANFAAEKSAWETTIRIEQAIEAISRKVSHQEHQLRNSLQRQGAIFADQLRDSEKALAKFKEQERLLVALIPSLEKSNKAASLFDAAATLLEQKRFDRSCELFLESIKLFEEGGDHRATNLAQMCFGAVLAEIENTEEGKIAFEKISHDLADREFFRDRLKHQGVVSLASFAKCSSKVQFQIFGLHWPVALEIKE